MRSVFFYTIGIAFACGIFVRSFFDIGISGVLFLLIISLGLALLWQKRSREFSSPLFLMSLMLLCFALGALRFGASDSAVSPLSDQVNEEVTLQGVISREPELRENNMHLYVKLDEPRETVLVTTDRYQTFSYGDRVTISGVLREPEPFETDLGRVFDYRGYLKAHGVSYMVPAAEVEKTGEGEGNAAIALLLAGKAKFMQSVESIIPEPEAGLGEGLLLGAKRALGDTLNALFRRTGVVHIVVLSGYNVMLVAEAIMRLLAYFFRPRTRMVIGIAGISAFALLVGLSATVVRASLMAVFVLIARATGRTYNVMRGLLIAALLMLVLDPYLLAFDPGFQLSFLATLGLIVLAPFVEQKLHRMPTAFQIREFVTATVTTQLFVLPLLLYQIGQFSVVAVLVNVLVLPMVPIAMFLTFVAGSLGLLFAPLGTLVGYAAYLSLGYVILVVSFFGGFSFAAFNVPAFPFWVALIAYACMGAYIYHLHKRGNETPTVPMPEVVDDLSDWIIESVDDAKALPFR